MEQPAQLRLDDQLCFALYAATNAVVRTYRPLLSRLGLTYTQYLVMMTLWESDDLSAGRIAGRLDLPLHALSPVLARLQAAGLVNRRKLSPDRRVVHVRLTRSGRALHDRALAVQQEVVCRTRLDPVALAALRQELQALTSDLERSPTDSSALAHQLVVVARPPQ